MSVGGDAGLIAPATLAQHLGLRELFETYVGLGDAPQDEPTWGTRR